MDKYISHYDEAFQLLMDKYISQIYDEAFQLKSNRPKRKR